MFKSWNHFHLQHKIVICTYPGISQGLHFKHYVVSCEPCECYQTFAKHGWNMALAQQNCQPAAGPRCSYLSCAGQSDARTWPRAPADAARKRGWIQSLWTWFCCPLLHLGRRLSVRDRPVPNPAKRLLGSRSCNRSHRGHFVLGLCSLSSFSWKMLCVQIRDLTANTKNLL